LQSINGPSAHIQGIEVSWEQRFSFLPGLLSGFGVSANYSYTQSGVTFPTTFDGGELITLPWPAKPRIPGTPALPMTSHASHALCGEPYDANIQFYNYSHVDAATDKDPILGLQGPGRRRLFYAHTQY